jgi:hypothetical protein
MGTVIHIGTREVLVPDTEPPPDRGWNAANQWMETFIDQQVLHVQSLIEELTDCYENPVYGRDLISGIKKIVSQWPG